MASASVGFHCPECVAENGQQVYTARDGGELRITVARWETPAGVDIGITGLEPDIVVAPDVVGGTDPILDEAFRLLGI